ncbi:GxxExxY protein [Limnoglobus roseus]|uniref:GxxExxY protein n=1 Tax=Limnoglobus roseus TaxID=2598579 RepID=UPI0021BCA0CC|nr:GxxExxY protein [Limnoglobus roseus]
MERVYHNALAIELAKRGIGAESQKKIDVRYEGSLVGEYYADFLVEGCVILELKSVETLAPEHDPQLLNYLKATDIDVGLLLNFGPKPQVRRKVFETARHQSQLSVLPSIL